MLVSLFIQILNAGEKFMQFHCLQVRTLHGTKTQLWQPFEYCLIYPWYKNARQEHQI